MARDKNKLSTIREAVGHARGNRRRATLGVGHSIAAAVGRASVTEASTVLAKLNALLENHRAPAIPDDPCAVAPARASGGRTGTKSWVTAEVKRLKAAGEISNGMMKADFARLLARRMRKAARSNESLRAVGYVHIANHLSAWGLWPISSI